MNIRYPIYEGVYRILTFYPDRPFAEIRHSERNKRVFEHHGGISSY